MTVHEQHSEPIHISLTSLIGGGYEIRISEPDLAVLGRAGLEAQVAELGFTPADIGTPTYYPYRQRWVIPVRKANDE